MILDQGAGPRRFLGYCTNVHPGETVDEIRRDLAAHARPLRERLAPGRSFSIGLRLGEGAVKELENSRVFESFRSFLADEDLVVTSLNVFPQGSFQGQGAKAAVYLPDWSRIEREDYTRRAAGVLTGLLPPDERFGTLSTLPLGSRRDVAGREALCARRLVALVHALARLEAERGVRIQLDLEPEPLCALETTEEVIAFHRDHLAPRARDLPTVDGARGAEQLARHLGACLDTCHAAVEFEDPGCALSTLEGAGIAVGKIQISNALEIIDPAGNPEALDSLRAFDEPRFLHQVISRGAEGELLRFLDLPDFFAALEGGLRPERARCHFHVPVHLPGMPPLATTQAALVGLLQQQRAHPSVRHLEVETYTLPILPGSPISLVDSLEQELRFAKTLLDGQGSSKPAGLPDDGHP